MDSVNLGEIFMDDNYSLESLLAKTQKNKLNLTELRDKLTQHQQDLNQTSLELFNNSYDRFYKLSYIIACLADPIQHLIDPLQNFRNQLGQLCQNHDNYVQEINHKLASLEETSKNKELAKLLLILIDRRDRIDRQMDNIDWSVKAVSKDNRDQALIKRADNVDYKIKCDLLERVNIELFYLISEVRAIQPTHDELIPIKKTLEAYLENRQCQLDRWFENAFLDAIESQDETLIDLTLRTYKQKGALQKLDSIWRNKIVKPYLDLILTERTTQSTDEIRQKYDLVGQFIERQLEIIDASFIARSFWAEVVNSLDKLERIYSLNELETFQQRFLDTKAFLEKQNKYISKIESNKDNFAFDELAIRLNTQKIMSKFNLKGYFNHRLSQIASGVETSLTKQPLSQMPVSPTQSQPGEARPPEEEIFSQFKLKICMHIYALVIKCWSPEIYIEQLELNFSQLACRVINRFADWLSKLRLSDFRITGPAAPDNNRQTNFLVKQDAIMRLLIEDCDRLVGFVNEFISRLVCADKNLSVIRKELIQDSFNALNNGLSNVRSLQRLIER